jgi:hypothetical protein
MASQLLVRMRHGWKLAATKSSRTPSKGSDTSCNLVEILASSFRDNKEPSSIFIT